MKNKLRKLFLLSVLGYGAAFGLPMDPQEVEELLDAMNRPKNEIMPLLSKLAEDLR